MRATVIGSKYALSSRIVVVESLTSELSPPITPAIASGLSPSAISRSFGSSVRVTLSSVTNSRVSPARRTTILPSGDFTEVERVQRLSEFEHHVVGRIDDVVERAHPAQFEPAPEPRGRRPDLDSGHRERGVARAQDRARRSKPKSKPARCRTTRANSRRAAGARAAWRANNAATSRARPRIDRQSPRFGVISTSSTVVVEVQIRGHVAAERRVGAERKNSRMILRQTELALRAEHALRADAANDCRLQRRFLAELRANQRERRDHARLHVGRAAHDFEFAFLARVDVAQIQPVRVGMLLDVDARARRTRRRIPA